MGERQLSCCLVKARRDGHQTIDLGAPDAGVLVAHIGANLGIASVLDGLRGVVVAIVNGGATIVDDRFALKTD